MNSRLVWSLSAAALFLSPVVPTHASKPPVKIETANPTAGLNLGPVTAYKLGNGMQVLVAPSQAADLVTLDVWVGAGTRRETAENSGTAHFLEHMFFKGTATRKPGDIDAAIEDLGGTLNATTSYDWAHFFVTVGSSDADPALAVLSDMLQNPALRAEDMNSERPVIVDEIRRNEATPNGQIAQVFNALEFPGHPYGRPITGTEESVAGIKRQMVLDFYQTYYVPSNATVILAGKITPEAGLALAQKYFGSWSQRPLPDNTTLPETPQIGIQTQQMVGGVDHSYLMMGFHAPSVQNKPDAWVMDVLLSWLGQGGNNQLEAELQHRRGIVRSISSNYLTQRDPGALTIFAEFDQGRETEVRDAILGDIKQIRDAPLSPNDLDAAKRALLASYLFDVQTNSGRANALGFYDVIDSYHYDTDYIDHVMAVTSEQVQQVARHYINPEAYTLVMLSPRANPQIAAMRP